MQNTECEGRLGQWKVGPEDDRALPLAPPQARVRGWRVPDARGGRLAAVAPLRARRRTGLPEPQVSLRAARDGRPTQRLHRGAVGGTAAPLPAPLHRAVERLLLRLPPHRALPAPRQLLRAMLSHTSVRAARAFGLHGLLNHSLPPRAPVRGRRGAARARRRHCRLPSAPRV